MGGQKTVHGFLKGRVPCPVCGYGEFCMRMVRVVVRKTTVKVWADGLAVLPSNCRECGVYVPCDRWPELRPDPETAAGIAAAPTNKRWPDSQGSRRKQTDAPAPPEKP